jgi:DNA polymerase-1
VSRDEVAVAFANGAGALWSPDFEVTGTEADIVERVRGMELERVRGMDVERPRWVWWAATHGARPMVRAGVHLARCWDVAEAHRLARGGWPADPGRCWAAAHGLPLDTLPAAPTGDLFDVAAATEAGLPDEALVRPDGHLRAEAVRGDWQRTPARLLQWARAAYDVAARQRALLLEAAGPRAAATAFSESAAALLCEELERDGLPVDQHAAEELIARSAGPRARTDAEATEVRRTRDQEVLRLARGHEGTDLRNPLRVRELLASAGIVVPTTRKWVLEPYRETHPLVAALLEWRKAERIATTYGYPWLDAHVGPDDRLRGRWTACDGGAGRMTAENGLHNLPAVLRPAVAAHPGHVLVRADLGQIEPRVLAAVSGDERFAAATQADDLYAPVAAALGVERPVAKVAVLAAMYGQRSGAAGEALKGLERAYPVAMGYLDRAYASGVARQSVRTHGGRLIRTGEVLVDGDPDSHAARDAGHQPARDAGHQLARNAGNQPARDGGSQAARDAARGRFVRNAVVQGSAAELFKAWAATVRATTAELEAQIVLCLHDELLVHVPAEHASAVCRLVEQALDDSARRWTGSTAVRFVADTSVIARWSDAKP